jgi:hypothetical protein
MSGFASLKQVEKVAADVEQQLRPVPVFGRAVPVQGGDGVRADPEGGRLMLAPGAYLIAFSVVARWRGARLVNVFVAAGGDERFRGPRAVAEREEGAWELFRNADENQLRHLDWDQTATRHLTGWSVVVIPPGSEPVAADRASTDGSHSSDT